MPVSTGDSEKKNLGKLTLKGLRSKEQLKGEERCREGRGVYINALALEKNLGGEQILTGITYREEGSAREFEPVGGLVKNSDSGAKLSIEPAGGENRAANAQKRFKRSQTPKN